MRNLILITIGLCAVSFVAAVPSLQADPPKMTSVTASVAAVAASTAAAPVDGVSEMQGEAQGEGTREVSDLDEHHRQIADNVLAVMNDPRWSRLRGLPTADYEDVARDIASAVDLGNDATLLATLAYMECGFAQFVDTLECNDPVWRASPEGQSIMGGKSCDGGNAYSIFQIHPVTDKTAPLYESCRKEAIVVRSGAARCALKIARASMEATSTLQNYTGEPGDYHPKADDRLRMANRAIVRHPFKD
jgi:hypothetical protein